MINKNLAQQEQLLLSQALQLYRKENIIDTLEDIFLTYSEVFLAYINLAGSDLEALKRSLFLHWYSFSEPNYLTGVSNLGREEEMKLLGILEGAIRNKLLDKELNWMLNYYAMWDFIYKRFPEFKLVNAFVNHRTEKHFPKAIDSVAMDARGQMGAYWNSVFSEND